MTKHKNKARSSALASLGLAAALAASASYAEPASTARQNDRDHGPGHHCQHHRDPQAAFRHLDQDNNGTVSQQEFVYAHEKMAERVRAHHAHRAQRDQVRAEKRKSATDLFSKLDANSDGSISRAEWDEGRSRMKQAREQRRQAHARHDRIDRADRLSGPRKSQKRKHHRMSAHEIFRSIDTDGNGQLTFEEFSAHHERVSQRMRSIHAKAEKK